MFKSSITNTPELVNDYEPTYYKLTKINPLKLNEDEDIKIKYNFKINSWVRSSAKYSITDCDENEQLLNLDNKEKVVTKEIKDSSDGLSMDDIRGAVGVEDGIAGLGSSVNNGKEAVKSADEGGKVEKVEDLKTNELEVNETEPASEEIKETETKETETEEIKEDKVEESAPQETKEDTLEEEDKSEELKPDVEMQET